MSDLLRQPALELARMVRDGEVSAHELVEASLARAETTAPLNHWTLLDHEGALAAADTIDRERGRAGGDGPAPGPQRPFAGVPLAIKDLFAPVAGLRMSQGSELVGDYVPDYDYALVRRFRAAGFVLIGKTQTPELGILPVTEPRRFGPARNPWDPDRTTGGSSGGSAGAVAAGAVPVAHGSDGGGSIRIPAACTGLVGLKPARGRISRAPDIGEHFLTTDGALTRTTADAAALLDVMAGYETGDASWAPSPEAPFAELARCDPGRLRVALTFSTPIRAPVDPVCAQAARDAAVLLEGLGHEVEEVDALWRGPDVLPAFSVVWATSVATSVRHAELVSGREATETDVEPLTWWLRQLGQRQSAPAYVGALARLHAFSREVVALWDRYDVALTPALAQRPVRHGEIDACGDSPAEEFRRSGEFTPYAAQFNVTGQPAVSVPLFHGDDGLPTAVQLVGPPAGEGLLLALSSQLERARPWAQRAPPDPSA
jgi:amidase